MVIRNGHHEKSVSQEDVLTAVKAVKDSFTKSLSLIKDEVKSSVDSRLENAERDMSFRVGSTLEKEMTGKFQVLFKETFEKEFDRRITPLMRSIDDRLDSLQKAYDATMQGQVEMLRQILTSLPVPQVTVNVPEQIPNVQVHVPEQKAPDVHVNVPEVKPVFEVNVPQMKAPDVHVRLPETVPPNVEVIVPAPRLVKKHIEYNAYGQPVDIEEFEKE